MSPLTAGVPEAFCPVRSVEREDLLTSRTSPAPATRRAEARRHPTFLSGRLSTTPVSPFRRGCIGWTGSVVGSARPPASVAWWMLELPAVVGQRLGGGPLRPRSGVTPYLVAAVNAEAEANPDRDGTPRWGIRRVPLRGDPPQVGRDRSSQRIGAPLTSNST